MALIIGGMQRSGTTMLHKCVQDCKILKIGKYQGNLSEQDIAEIVEVAGDTMKHFEYQL